MRTRAAPFSASMRCWGARDADARAARLPESLAAGGACSATGALVVDARHPAKPETTDLCRHPPAGRASRRGTPERPHALVALAPPLHRHRGGADWLCPAGHESETARAGWIGAAFPADGSRLGQRPGLG